MIGKLLKMKGPQVYNNSVPVIPCADPTLIYGVELEIEGINMETLVTPDGFRLEKDGSLRNNGLEFITYPMDFSRLHDRLKCFFTVNKFNEKNYSERCSVHVHANVLDMTWEQLQVLVLTYQVFERVLFGFIGNERDKNIFCVPLHDTLMTRTILEKTSIDVMKDRMKTWEKYTALNFLPIWEQGSIEFRHMAGTSDVGYILTWCNIIGRLFAFAKTTPMEKAKEFFLTLNTTSYYREAMNTVFKEESAFLMQAPEFDENVEAGVLTAKWSLLGNKPFRSKNKKHFLEETATNRDKAEKWLKDRGFLNKELFIIPADVWNSGGGDQAERMNGIMWAMSDDDPALGVWSWRNKTQDLPKQTLTYFILDDIAPQF